MIEGKYGPFETHKDGSVPFKGRWYVPKCNRDIRENIMREGHYTPYSVHPGGYKLYKELKQKFW